MSIISYLLMLAFSAILVKGQMIKYLDETSENIRDSATVTKDWERLQNIVTTLVNDGVRGLMPLLMGNFQDLNISSSCNRDSLHVIGGIRKLKTWALRYLDSSAKLVDGFITGTYLNYGAYDECVDTRVINQRSGKQKGQVMFTGKYCSLRIKASLPPAGKTYKFGEVIDELKGIYKEDTIFGEAAKYAVAFYSFSARLGLCVPSGCSADDLNQILSKVANYTRLYMKVKNCEVKEEPTYTPLMIFVMSFYSFTGFVVLLASVTDIYYYKSGNKPHRTSVRLLLAFSFVSNFRKLMNTSTSSKSLSCINGIRFLTMSWVILGHSYSLALVSQVVSGLLYVKNIAQDDFAFQAVVNAVVAVDTFFFLGGFLVCYISTKHVKIAGNNFSIKVYILHRLWRILPVLCFVILYTFIAELVTSGPVAKDVFTPIVNACKNYWWTSLLFINNIYLPEEGCIPHTWYLGVDMQLYIASLIILVPLLRWPRVGVSVAVLSLVASMIATAVHIYVNNFPPTFSTSTLDIHVFMKFMAEHYYMPFPHAGPYIVGILAGYFLAVKPELKIKKVILWLGWSCAIIFSTSALYGPFEWNRGREPTFWETMFFSSCHKVAWSLSLAWMVICCSTGHGGIVNYILSWKFWIPLGRLTYTAYLVHYILIMSVLASSRDTFAPLHVTAVWVYFGHLVATYGVAFVCSMLIESPLMTVEKFFLPQRKNDNPTKETESKANQASTAVQIKEIRTQNSDRKLDALESSKWTEKEIFVYKL